MEQDDTNVIRPRWTSPTVAVLVAGLFVSFGVATLVAAIGARSVVGALICLVMMAATFSPLSTALSSIRLVDDAIIVTNWPRRLTVRCHDVQNVEFAWNGIGHPQLTPVGRPPIRLRAMETRNTPRTLEMEQIRRHIDHARGPVQRPAAIDGHRTLRRPGASGTRGRRAPAGRPAGRADGRRRRDP